MCSDWLISKSVLRALNPIEEKNASGTAQNFRDFWTVSTMESQIVAEDVHLN